MNSRIIAFFLLLNLSFHTSYGQAPDPAKQWVDSVYAELSASEQIAQLIMVAAYSNRGPDHKKQISALVSKQGIGGLIFFQGGPVRQAQLTNSYQAQAQVPLLIGQDFEWGLGMRLDSTISFPVQMTLGAIRNDSLIYEMGKEIARQCRDIGVHVNFAPVIDVNSNPDNPVINYRSFGEDKYRVAAKGKAYMQGMQDEGLLITVKHFPGHGDTHQDSHLTLPRIDHDSARLHELELYPFRQLFQAGANGVMVAHLNIPAWEPDTTRASTLSKPIVTGLLREEMGFDGLIFTDALTMKGVTKYYEPGEECVEALRAGNDVLLYPEDVAVSIRKIKKALRKGLLTQELIEERVKKVLYAKYQAGLHNWQPLSTQHLADRLNNPHALALREQLFREAVTVASNDSLSLPLHVLDTSTFASLSIGVEEESLFQQTLGRYAPFVNYQLSAADSLPAQHDLLIEKLRRYDFVVIGLHDLNVRRGDNYGVPDWASTFVETLSKKTHVIMTVFGSPYALRGFGGLPTLLCTMQERDVTQVAAAEVIFGAYAATGTLPVSPDAQLKVGTGIRTRPLQRLGYARPHAVGMDEATLAKIHAIGNETVTSGASPGCQILVARHGKVVFHQGYGYQTYDSIAPVDTETIYDIASITKVAATLQAAMFLQGRGLLDINKKASDYLPELKGTNKEDVGITPMLTHQAGLIPFIPHFARVMSDSLLYQTMFSVEPLTPYEIQVSPGMYTVGALQDSLWKWTIESNMRSKPDTAQHYTYKYSDIAFYILQRICEQLLNQSLEGFMDQNFYQPMGLGSMTYLPLCKYPIDRIAPTEEDAYFRNILVCGMVHDPGAAMYGGIAGHAGLFSTAWDLAVLMQMNLNDGVYGEHRYLPAGTVATFNTAPYLPLNRRGIGWDKPLIGKWYGPTSEYASPSTFGHTGFTGTAAWADPEFDLVYIFLSNRIFPSAENVKLIRNNIRTRIQDIIYESIFTFDAVGHPK